MLEPDADFLLGLRIESCAGQVTGNEAPEMEVDEKSFLPTAPKNADAADDTESWCVSLLRQVIASTTATCDSAHACADALFLLCSPSLLL